MFPARGPLDFFEDVYFLGRGARLLHSFHDKTTHRALSSLGRAVVCMVETAWSVGRELRVEEQILRQTTFRLQKNGTHRGVRSLLFPIRLSSLRRARIPHVHRTSLFLPKHTQGARSSGWVPLLPFARRFGSSSRTWTISI